MDGQIMCFVCRSTRLCQLTTTCYWNCACFCNQKHVKQYKAKMELFFPLLIEREGKGNQSNDGDHISKVDNCVGLV